MDPGHTSAELDPGQQHARNAVAATQRLRHCRRLAPAVADEHDILGEQRLKPGKIAFLGGGEEAAG